VPKVAVFKPIHLWALVKVAMALAFNTRVLQLHLDRFLKFELAATQLAQRVVGTAEVMAMRLLLTHNPNRKVAVVLLISALHHTP
jgi:hypothetical protein